MDVFRDLGHESAVSSLVKDDVNVVERGANRFAVAQVAFNEFHLIRYPHRFSAAMRLWLKIIQHAHFPALTHQQIRNMRADQARATGHKGAFSMLRHDTRSVMDAVL